MINITTEYIDAFINDTKKYIDQSLLHMSLILNRTNFNILDTYKQKNLIPFSFKLSVKDGQKQVNKLPNQWNNINSFDDNNINKKLNGLAIRTGEHIDQDHLLILVDVDLYKNNTRSNWEKFLQDNNIDSLLDLNTPIQKTGNNGLHYLFKVHKDQAKFITKNLTGLTINDSKLDIDIKFKNGMLFSAPTSYKDNGEIKNYIWLKSPAIVDFMELPKFIFDIIVENIDRTIIKATRNTNNTVEQLTDDDEDLIELDMNKIKELKNSSIDKISSDVKLLMECIKNKYIDDYMTWNYIGIYLYCINSNESFLDLWKEISKKSNKFYRDPFRCDKEWKYFTKRNYSGNGLRNLYNFVKNTNFKQLQEIQYLLNFNQNCKFENIYENGTKYNIIKFNSKFITESDIFVKAYEEFVNSEIRSMCIKSRYGSGKTRFIEKDLLVKFNEKFRKVLFLTYRKSLTRDIHQNFKDLGFESYMDILHLDKSNRLICQYESVSRLFHDDPFTDELTRLKTKQYDLIIIDEAKSFYNHTFSPTQKRKEQYNFINVFELCSNANKLIFLDGDNDSQVYYNALCHGGSIIVENEYNDINKTIKIYDNRDRVNNLMYEKLDNNKKIVIVCQSANKVLSMVNTLSELYPNKTIKYYTSEDMIKQKIEELNNVNKYWIDTDILIYSPTVESGIDFNVKNAFDSLFVILSDRTNSARSLHQMQCRVRYFNENEIHVLNDNEYYYYEKRNYWTFKQVEESIHMFLNEEKTIIDNQVIRLNNVAYKTNYIYWKLEQLNSSKHIFLNLYVDLATSKGYNVEFITDNIKQKKESNNIAFDRVLNLDLSEYSKSKETKKYDEIKNTIEDENAKQALEEQVKALKNINLEFKQEELNKLKKKDQIENVEHNTFLNKMYYINLLDRKTIEENGEDFIKEFWKNGQLIYNYLNLLNLGYSETGDIVRKVKEEKTKTIIDLIKNLGFDGFTDTRKLDRETFTNNINKLFDAGGMLENLKKYKANFNLNRKLKDNSKDESIKQKMGIINSILDGWCLSIKTVQTKYDQKPVYSYIIEQTKGIKTIIKNKVLSQTIFIDESLYEFYGVRESDFDKHFSGGSISASLNLFFKTSNDKYLYLNKKIDNLDIGVLDDE